MDHFQAAQRQHVSAGLPLEMLCAVINNNMRCYDESLEFAEGLEERFADNFKGEESRLGSWLGRSAV
jgi:exocyst complex component 3